MPLSAQELVDRLVVTLPVFAMQWSSLDNLSRYRDGSFTLCGVFAECSHYVREAYMSLSPEKRDELACFVEECMENSDTEVATAAATCFLENLTFEQFSTDWESRLGPQSLRFVKAFTGA